LLKKRDEFAEDAFVMKTLLTPESPRQLNVKVPACSVSWADLSFAEGKRVV